METRNWYLWRWRHWNEWFVLSGNCDLHRSIYMPVLDFRQGGLRKLRPPCQKIGNETMISVTSNRSSKLRNGRAAKNGCISGPLRGWQARRSLRIHGNYLDKNGYDGNTELEFLWLRRSIHQYTSTIPYDANYVIVFYPGCKSQTLPCKGVVRGPL